MKLILTSSLDLYRKNLFGKRIAHNFGNENGILDMFKTLTPKRNHFVYVASVEDNYEATDIYAGVAIKSFKKTFPFERYTILDGRQKENAKEIIESADFIFLAGGHVPTQNNFFQNINLRELIKNTNALVVGVSAGSMNSADVVYAQPELEGEAFDKDYKKYIKGLGLTDINILPHFDPEVDDMLDGKSLLKDITLPDSKVRPVIAYQDGTYIFDNGETQTVFGKSYLIANGEMKQLSIDQSKLDITGVVKKYFGAKKIKE